ncbi:cell division cycle-associated 7-like protein isoform X1 [Osmerus eperlanus]|uniref:cell division cycle-associated 7-like protein isoform X1 n=1 Tax=Osmerus eperlanus TaxID=29151 RepID=UPI002E145688
MPLSSKTPRAIADIFESPSEDEDFHGFGVCATLEPASEDSRDSLYSGDSEKPVLCFRSKFITTELFRMFTESDGEDEEFEGFSGEEGRLSDGLNTLSVVSEEESDVDTGFYSDGEESAPPKRKSLCVAFRFPTKRLSAQKVPDLRQPIRAAHPERRASERTRLKRGVAEVGSGRVSAREAGKRLPERKEEEEEDSDEVKMDIRPQVLSKRDKNIQENKAMLAKLFADLSSVAELTPLTSPKKKRRVSENPSPRKRACMATEGGGRKNPSRKARPPENFGVEKRSESPTRLSRPAKIIDIRKLIEVDDELRAMGSVRKRRSGGGRKRRSEVRPVDDITQEELDNVAQRAKDKILDKDHGSTCHQCRQKTLDTKTVCRSGYCVGVKGQFCGPCLRNRYGEDVCDTLLNPTWECPLCRGMCNCSLCRRKEGRCATGNLVRLAQYNGKSNVHQYLESIQRDLK